MLLFPSHFLFRSSCCYGNAYNLQTVTHSCQDPRNLKCHNRRLEWSIWQTSTNLTCSLRRSGTWFPHWFFKEIVMVCFWECRYIIIIVVITIFTIITMCFCSTTIVPLVPLELVVEQKYSSASERIIIGTITLENDHKSGTWSMQMVIGLLMSRLVLIKKDSRGQTAGRRTGKG